MVRSRNARTHLARSAGMDLHQPAALFPGSHIDHHFWNLPLSGKPLFMPIIISATTNSPNMPDEARGVRCTP